MWESLPVHPGGTLWGELRFLDHAGEGKWLTGRFWGEGDL